MATSLFDTLNAYTNATGQVVTRTTGSVVAGVGDAVSRVTPSLNKEIVRPEVADPTSEEAFQKFKEYNVETNLRVSERKMWAGTVEKILGYIMMGASAGLGFAVLGSSPVIAAVAFSGAIALTVGVFFAMHQTANKEFTAKNMDVSDYQVKRQAGLIAQEIKKVLTEEKAPESAEKSAGKHVVSNVEWEGHQVSPEHVTRVH